MLISELISRLSKLPPSTPIMVRIGSTDIGIPAILYSKNQDLAIIKLDKLEVEIAMSDFISASIDEL